MKWQSGYHGEDSLRSKAEKAFRDEIRGAKGGDIPASMSAPQNTKMRPFRSGGSAGHLPRAADLSYSGKSAGHLPRAADLSYGGKAANKRGGRCKADGGKVEKRDLGGIVQGLMGNHRQQQASRFAEGMNQAGNMRADGGRVEKKAEGGKAAKMAFGGGWQTAPDGSQYNNDGIAQQRRPGSWFNGIDVKRLPNNSAYQPSISEQLNPGINPRARQRANQMVQNAPPSRLRDLLPKVPRSPLYNSGVTEQNGYAGTYTGGLKKGGHAGHSKAADYTPPSKRHRLNHDQHALHLPKSSHNHASRHMSVEKANKYGNGGNARLNVETVREFENAGKPERSHRVRHEEHHFEKKHGKHHKGIGGLLGGLGGTYFGGPIGGMLGSALGGMLPFKKGGHAHHKAIGGFMQDIGNQGLTGGPLPRRLFNMPRDENVVGRNPATWGPSSWKNMSATSQPYGNQGLNGMINRGAYGGRPDFYRPDIHRNPLPFKEGGEMNKRRGGHTMKRASGGTVYEREMVGEKPGTKAHRYNYESEMRGEKCVSKPSSRHMSKKGLRDMEHGQLFHDGGKVATAKRGGHKYAVGAVAKIRHGQATTKGVQKPNRKVIRNDLF